MVVVVVVQTRCNDEMFVHDAARDAPDYGGRVHRDTAPSPVPVCRALKNPHSPSQSAATAGQTLFSALRTTLQLSLHTTGMQQPVLSSIDCNCGSSAVSPHLHARTAGPVRPHKWDIGHRVQQLGNVRRTVWTIGIATAPRRRNEPARPAQQERRLPCTATV